MRSTFSSKIKTLTEKLKFVRWISVENLLYVLVKNSLNTSWKGNLCTLNILMENLTIHQFRASYFGFQLCFNFCNVFLQTSIAHEASKSFKVSLRQWKAKVSLSFCIWQPLKSYFPIVVLLINVIISGLIYCFYFLFYLNCCETRIFWLPPGINLLWLSFNLSYESTFSKRKNRPVLKKKKTPVWCGRFLLGCVSS